MNWFGPPWWSYICYSDDGRLLTELQVPFPCGETCLWCGEEFGPGDSGTRKPFYRATGPTAAYTHKECGMRSVLGPVAHLEGRCYCHGGLDYETPGNTKRQESLAVWAWVERHGVAAIRH
jgi:hypothetical protein